MACSRTPTNVHKSAGFGRRVGTAAGFSFFLVAGFEAIIAGVPWLGVKRL